MCMSHLFHTCYGKMHTIEHSMEMPVHENDLRENVHHLYEICQHCLIVGAGVDGVYVISAAESKITFNIFASALAIQRVWSHCGAIFFCPYLVSRQPIPSAQSNTWVGRKQFLKREAHPQTKVVCLSQPFLDAQDKCNDCLRELLDSETIGEFAFATGKKLYSAYVLLTMNNKPLHELRTVCEHTHACKKLSTKKYPDYLCQSIHEGDISRSDPHTIDPSIVVPIKGTSKAEDVPVYKHLTCLKVPPQLEPSRDRADQREQVRKVKFANNFAYLNLIGSRHSAISPHLAVQYFTIYGRRRESLFKTHCHLHGVNWNLYLVMIFRVVLQLDYLYHIKVWLIYASLNPLISLLPPSNTLKKKRIHTQKKNSRMRLQISSKWISDICQLKYIVVKCRESLLLSFLHSLNAKDSMQCQSSDWKIYHCLSIRQNTLPTSDLPKCCSDMLMLDTNAINITNITLETRHKMTPSLPQNPMEIPVIMFQAYSETTEKQKCYLCHNVIVPNSPVKYLCCTHIYHTSCIDEWLHQNIHCPVCSTQCIFPIATAIPAKSQLNHPSSTTPLKGDIYDQSTPYIKDPPKLFSCRLCNQPFERDASVRPETSGCLDH
uniref:AlNc14C7G979 protein n=2 Tax=Albugo laibachii Nc14 TaxID=890382 RepID=F0W1P7_9STRA|nr:AlNc14C7G979 [Albugo laibachii Nc14]|eukprot:CCA14976.1 AlNc14C7G979 [Albugo laibachii Nc14]